MHGEYRPGMRFEDPGARALNQSKDRASKRLRERVDTYAGEEPTLEELQQEQYGDRKTEQELEAAFFSEEREEQQVIDLRTRAESLAQEQQGISKETRIFGDLSSSEQVQLKEVSVALRGELGGRDLDRFSSTSEVLQAFISQEQHVPVTAYVRVKESLRDMLTLKRDIGLRHVQEAAEEGQYSQEQAEHESARLQAADIDQLVFALLYLRRKSSVSSSPMRKLFGVIKDVVGLGDDFNKQDMERIVRDGAQLLSPEERFPTHIQEAA